MKIDCRIKLNVPGTLSRFDPRFRKAQKFLDSEVLRTSAPYVPMRSGALMLSGTTGSQIGSGKIVYNAPYAKVMYYGKRGRGRDSKGRFTKASTFNYSTDEHPQACAQWFEKAKATHKEAWFQGVEKILRG